MKIFLSWSGDISKKITSDLKDFLKTTIQALDPFFSKQDIAKGRRWSPELAKQLNDTNVGIIVLTKENTKAPWILFEAGALAKNITSGFVCTLLVDIKDTDISGPLSDFQNTKFNKDDFRQLLNDLNDQIEKPVDKHILDSAFEKHWSDFEKKVKGYLVTKVKEPEKQIREDKEVWEEILRIVRKFEYKHIYKEKDFFDAFDGKVVKFNEKENVVEFYAALDMRTAYEIPLQQLSDTGEILDFIFQVYRKKGWCTPKHIYQFLECLEELSDLYFHTNAQGLFCPGGAIMDINWNKKTKKQREYNRTATNEN